LSTRDVSFQIDPGLGISAAELNVGVRRFDPAPGARSLDANPVFADFTGNISVPVLSIHDTGDAFVPFKFEQDYRQKTLTAGSSNLLVQRAIRRAGHCNFSAQERNLAFDDLVVWLEHGIQPRGEDFLTADTAHLGVEWTTPLERDDPLIAGN
jgi:fermentation-respiration switch protein FrsA (DUF1100 family)